jgi:hypothetical protein
MTDMQTNGPNRQTPIDLLFQTYELFIEQHLEYENESSRESGLVGDEERKLPETLRYFWDKLGLLLKAGCQSIEKSADDADFQPVLHAILMLSNRHSQRPILIDFVMKRCLDREANILDAYGNYPLHHGVLALAHDNAVNVRTVQKILDASAKAARLRGSNGHFPLTSLLATTRTGTYNITSTGSGKMLIKDMARAYPSALFGSEVWSDELAPHLIAMLHRQNDVRYADQVHKKLDSVFELLRTEPGLMKHI